MSDNFNKILVAVAGALTSLVVAVVLSFIAGQRYVQKSLILPQRERVDTLVVFDTITQYKPIIEERVVLQKVSVPVVDTLWLHDTMYVYLQKEQVVWQDSLSRVYASGIMPQVDSVQHYISERIVTRELTKVLKKPCRWGVGVHAGYGIMIGNEFLTAPYVGIGVSYNIISW